VATVLSPILHIWIFLNSSCFIQTGQLYGHNAANLSILSLRSVKTGLGLY
jgi:hypothetical protein